MTISNFVWALVLLFAHEGTTGVRAATSIPGFVSQKHCEDAAVEARKQKAHVIAAFCVGASGKY